MMETLKAAVIGSGAMGVNHARIYAGLGSVELVGVCDMDKAQAKKVSDQHKCTPYTDHKMLLEGSQPDLVSIATPTQSHTKVALDCIKAGVNVLVEKPISDTVANAQKMIDAAQKHDVKLMVGHIERFNPAIIELKRRLDRKELGRVFSAHATRVGPFPHRIRDVGVVIDLAVHDIDIMRYLCQSDVKRVYAETEKKIHTKCEDMLSGLLKFRSGAIGVLDINWLTPEKFRWIKIIGEKGMYIVQYIPQELTFYENKRAKDKQYTYQNILMGVAEGDIHQIRIDKNEPLKTELEQFIGCVKDDLPPPVSGLDGLKALEVAQAIISSSKKNQVIIL